MGTKTLPIIRSEVVTQVKNRIAEITDPLRLRNLFILTPWGSEIQQIIEYRFEEVARPTALAETAKCTTEEEAKILYKTSPRPNKGEADSIYLECWKKFADNEALRKASTCQTHEDALTLYKNSPDSSEAKGIYFKLLKSFEEKMLHSLLSECKTPEEIDNLIKNLVKSESQEHCRKVQESMQNGIIRDKLLRCTSVDEAEELLEEIRGLPKIRELALFIFERLATEKLPEETASCQTSEDARRLVNKYERLPNVSKVYKDLYLELLAESAKVFAESLTGNTEDVIREVYNKCKLSPEGSEARRIYHEKYCELLDERDVELLPFDRDISISDFSGWYTEARTDYDSEPRRMETIFMKQLLDQGLV